MRETGKLLLGAVADDLTGATDLALMLSKGGMRTVQVMDPASIPDAASTADAVVVALKSRTMPAAEAVRVSEAAARALKDAGAGQLLFKYCSTFDSTDEGNIGPVADALLALTGSPIAVACPAFPATGRTLFQGHLFVNGRLLSESGMQHHPLTPMTDPDLVRVLERQSCHSVGLVSLATVRSGESAIRDRLSELAESGARLAIADAVDDDDLLVLGRALADAPLITGGSGIALGLPDNFRNHGFLDGRAGAAAMPRVRGRAAILSGSCSTATNEQVRRALASGLPARRIVPTEISDPQDTATEILDWAARQDDTSPVLVHATDTPENVRAVQTRLGREAAGALVEAVMAHVATGLRNQGVRRFVVAGGETSGAVVASLGVGAFRIGPEIAPGVSWTETMEAEPLAMTLKSGNFGGPDFFEDALAMLDH